MDAKTLFTVIEPHVQMMEPHEKQSLTKLIVGIHSKTLSSGRRRILSLQDAKTKLRTFRRREMKKEGN